MIGKEDDRARSDVPFIAGGNVEGRQPVGRGLERPACGGSRGKMAGVSEGEMAEELAGQEPCRVQL